MLLHISIIKQKKVMDREWYCYDHETVSVVWYIWFVPEIAVGILNSVDETYFYVLC